MTGLSRRDQSSVERGEVSSRHRPGLQRKEGSQAPCTARWSRLGAKASRKQHNLRSASCSFQQHSRPPRSRESSATREVALQSPSLDRHPKAVEWRALYGRTFVVGKHARRRACESCLAVAGDQQGGKSGLIVWTLRAVEVSQPRGPVWPRENGRRRICRTRLHVCVESKHAACFPCVWLWRQTRTGAVRTG